MPSASPRTGRHRACVARARRRRRGVSDRRVWSRWGTKMTDYRAIAAGRPGRAGHRRRQRHRPGDGARARPGRRARGGERHRCGCGPYGRGEIGRGEAHRLDVADEAEVEAVVGTVIDRHGRIDILVNNAGLGARMPTVDLPTERWRHVLAVNLDGSFFCAREAGRHMMAAGRGAVVNVASMGLVGNATTDTSPTTAPRARSSTSRARSPASGRPVACGSTRWPRPSPAPA